MRRDKGVCSYQALAALAAFIGMGVYGAEAVAIGGVEPRMGHEGNPRLVCRLEPLQGYLETILSSVAHGSQKKYRHTRSIPTDSKWQEAPDFPVHERQ